MIEFVVSFWTDMFWSGALLFWSYIWRQTSYSYHLNVKVIWTAECRSVHEAEVFFSFGEIHLLEGLCFYSFCSNFTWLHNMAWLPSLWNASGQANVWDLYRREKQLGTGSFGTAYKAVKIKTGEERVIKAVTRPEEWLKLVGSKELVVAGVWWYVQPCNQNCVFWRNHHLGLLNYRMSLYQYVVYVYSHKHTHATSLMTISQSSNSILSGPPLAAGRRQVIKSMIQHFMASLPWLATRLRRAGRLCRWMRLNKRSWSWGRVMSVICGIFFSVSTM